MYILGVFFLGVLWRRFLIKELEVFVSFRNFEM